MKIKEIITEITKIAQREYIGGRAELRRYSLPANLPWSELPGHPDLQWAIEYGGRYSAFVLIKEPAAEIKNQLIGALSLENYYGPLNNAKSVETINVAEDRRGMGIAKALYSIVLRQMKVTLVSGDSQTAGGRRNWLSLASSPGVEVKGLLKIDDTAFGHTTPVDLSAHMPHEIAAAKREHKADQASARKKIEQLVDLGLQYVGETKNHWEGLQHYFAFDVVGGTGQVDPAVKNALSHIYGDRGFDTLLYAKLV